MSKWLDLTRNERLAILTAVEKAEKLQQESAVEKDWWVTAVIKALFKTSCAAYLSFKGGTSLSKGWGLIERFSEDIDLALDHSFFGIERTNKKQRDNLCRKSRAYIIDTLATELDNNLKEMGITGYRVEAVTERMTKEGPVHINSNTDPTVLLVHYETILDTIVEYIPPRIKIEISCISPFHTLIIHCIPQTPSHSCRRVPSSTNGVRITPKCNATLSSGTPSPSTN